AGLIPRFFDRALFDTRDPGRNTDHDPRFRPPPAVHAMDEVADHLLRHVEVGDDAVLQRTNRLDVPGGPSDHPLRLVADGEDVTGVLVDRDDGRLVQDDALAPDVDERVRRAEVNSHVTAEVL